jgi:hypothetical protein
MNKQRKLVLQVLNGPLDGAVLTLQSDTAWSCAGSGPLVFPWDDELGKPQACFIADEQGWSLQSFKSPHGTHRMNQRERLTEGRIQLAEGDLLGASSTWLLVHQVV